MSEGKSTIITGASPKLKRGEEYENSKERIDLALMNQWQMFRALGTSVKGLTEEQGGSTPGNIWRKQNYKG